jgi:hypothetical protein
MKIQLMFVIVAIKNTKGQTIAHLWRRYEDHAYVTKGS